MAGQGRRRTGAARERLLTAALGLFARHGVSGTSLQMIADELGVTKAAVYHQFQSKEDIVLAVITPALESLAEVADAAEAQSTRAGRREAALCGLVDLIVGNRRLAAVIYSDPTVGDLVSAHPALLAFSHRINDLLLGPDPDNETLVAASMVGGGLASAGVDPRLAEIDDGTLRDLMLSTARRILRIRPVRAAA